MMLDALNEEGRAGSRNEFRGRVPLILGASLGLIMAVNSTLVYSMGVFIAEIERQFGWHRSDISLCYTIFTGVLFLGSGLAGRVADRVSPAQLIGLSMLAYGAMLVVMPLVVHSVWSLWVAYALVSLLGLGATQVVLLKPVSGAFQRQRGMAIGLSLAGGGIGAVVIPLITAVLVKQGGWAWGYRGLGLIVLAVAPVVWLLLRSRSSAPAPSRAGAIHEGRTIGEARRSRQFWALLLDPLPAPALDAHNHSGGSHHSSSGNHAGSLVAEDAHAIAAVNWLNAQALAHKIEYLVLIAAPRTLGEMRRHYHKQLEQELMGELTKDLSGRKGPEILAALRGK
jgi:protein required for attachment to host cells/fucose permease